MRLIVPKMMLSLALVAGGQFVLAAAYRQEQDMRSLNRRLPGPAVLSIPAKMASQLTDTMSFPTSTRKAR